LAQNIRDFAARIGSGPGLLTVVALALVAVSLIMLERARAGLDFETMRIGSTPATLIAQPQAEGPVVVVAHGFAGSQQLMQAFSLTLARAGYRALAFDFEGHGGNPVPMSGDVTAIDGTTALLVEETRRVIARARALPGSEAGIALLGHSMATDILVRAALAERDAGNPVDAVIAISMFSGAVSATAPERLLIISGEWEGRLREQGLAAVRQLDPDAVEGQTVRAGETVRLALVAPRVEHVGVLYSQTALNAARRWLDESFERRSADPALYLGTWVLGLLGGIVLLFVPVSRFLPRNTPVQPDVSAGRFSAATVAPMIVAPLLATRIDLGILPVLVADYLAVHLLVYGALQMAVLRAFTWRVWHVSGIAAGALVLWGIGVFGLALDRYAASFVPIPERLGIIALLCVGTVPFMVADGLVSGGGRGALWRRVAARVAFLVSLVLAAVLGPEGLGFLLVIVPVILLFYLVHGLMGRWVARQTGAVTAGLALGLVLAWALGVSFPLFVKSA